jgi:hypothetical protein
MLARRESNALHRLQLCLCALCLASRVQFTTHEQGVLYVCSASPVIACLIQVTVVFCVQLAWRDAATLLRPCLQLHRAL